MAPKSLRLAGRLRCVEVSIQAREFIVLAIEDASLRSTGSRGSSRKRDGPGARR
jgi:hypothetical protein